MTSTAGCPRTCGAERAVRGSLRPRTSVGRLAERERLCLGEEIRHAEIVLRAERRDGMRRTR